MPRLLVVLGLLLLAVRPSLAGTVTYQFTGVCTDCSGDVTAQLTLQDYTPGTDIGSAFVSFTYDGSNLVSSFTIEQGSGDLSVQGSIPTSLPGPADIDIVGSAGDIVGHVDTEFSTSTNGSWSISGVGVPYFDYGSSSTWSLVPEPGSLVIVGSGLIGLVFARRRVRTIA
jgi:hypothetical protein